MTLLRGTVLFFTAMLIQWWWNTHIAYWGIAPQILLAFTVLIAARRGPVPAMLLGFIWGLYADSLRADLFGANALLYTLAAYFAGTVRRQMDLRSIGPLAATVFIVSWMYAILLIVLNQLFLKSFIWGGLASLIITPFLNVILVIIGAVIWDLSGHS
jgi:rod shape-determining protein MreD